MTTTVFFDPAVGGDGSSVSDGTQPADPNGLGGGGHRTKFVPALAQFVAIAKAMLATLTAILSGATAVATSTSSNSVAASGTKSWNVGTGKTFTPGMEVLAARTSAATTVWMTGKVNAYANSGLGQLDVVIDNCPAAAAGTGPFTDWSISVTGAVNTTTAKLNVTQAAKLSGILSPTALVADVNDYAPTGIGTAAVLRIDPGAANRTITGLSAGEDGELKVIENISASFDLYLAGQNAGSAAANRFNFTTGRYLHPGQNLILIYDATAARWKATTLAALLASDIRLGTSFDGSMSPGDFYAAQAVVGLTDAPTIAVDMSTFINAGVTIAGNRTLGNPTNAKPGQSGFIQFLQDLTGTRTLAVAANWKRAGGAIALSTPPSSIDILLYLVITATYILYDVKRSPS